MAQVLNNTIIINEVSPANIQEDHGMIWNGKCRIRYFDIDGTLLKLEYLSKGEYTVPPVHPNYDPEYLVFAEWNYDTVADPIQQPMDIGATYNTIDGRTYIFISVNQFTGYDATLSIHAVQIDWGDGTIDDQLTHTYAADGKYIIKLVCNDESEWIVNAGILYDPGSGSDTYYYSYSLNSAITKIYVGDGGWGNIGSNFSSCANLEIISLPPKTFNFTWSNDTDVNGCYNLQAIIMPRNWSLGLYVGSNYTIKAISQPKIEDWRDNIDVGGVCSCEIIQSYGSRYPEGGYYPILFGPETVTRVTTDIFIGGRITTFILLSPTVPELVVNTYSSLEWNSQLIIYVKDELVDQYKNATNWSIFEDYRFKPLSTSPYNF